MGGYPLMSSSYLVISVDQLSIGIQWLVSFFIFLLSLSLPFDFSPSYVTHHSGCLLMSHCFMCKQSFCSFALCPLFCHLSLQLCGALVSTTLHQAMSKCLLLAIVGSLSFFHATSSCIAQLVSYCSSVVSVFVLQLFSSHHVSLLYTTCQGSQNLWFII